MNLPLRQYWDLLVTYLASQWRWVVALTLLILSSIGLQLASPQVIRHFIDTTQISMTPLDPAIGQGTRDALVWAAALYIGITLAQRATAIASEYAGANVGMAATNALRVDLTRHCLRLDMPFHKQHPPGELIERISGDVNALANFFSQLVVKVLGNSVLVLGILLLLCREDWRVGLGMTLYVIIVFGILGALQRVAVTRWGQAHQANAEQFGFLEEHLGGTEDVCANGAEAYVMQRLYGLMRRVLERQRAAALVSNLAFVGTNFLFALGYAAGLSIGAFLYTRGEVTIGTAYLVVAYVGMLATPLESIRRQAQDLQRATASVERVKWLLTLQPDVRESVRATLPTGMLGIEMVNVTFGYGEHESVLRDLSLRLEPGQVLGVLGRTGGGKSTLTRLLFRLYDPSAGTIKLGGIDIRDVALEDLRRRVGMVTQDVQLFWASVRDNLTFFDPSIGDAEIERAIEDLGLMPWLRTLSRSLDTSLAAGKGLSAGQAQLLAFTRVFLKDPGLVILDEASSRLDPLTERLLEQAIDRLLRDRTAIVIAHRLKTVQRADVILILEGGRIVEYGPRVELAANPRSRFSSLLRA
jgi:ATP-binding cassette, subfamily B, bacterial